jgi:hypothetical protein
VVMLIQWVLGCSLLLHFSGGPIIHKKSKNPIIWFLFCAAFIIFATACLGRSLIYSYLTDGVLLIVGGTLITIISIAKKARRTT